MLAAVLLASCGSVDESRDPHTVQTFGAATWALGITWSFELHADCSVRATKPNYGRVPLVGTGSVPADECLAFKTFVASSSMIHALGTPSESCPPGTDNFTTYTLTLTDGTTYQHRTCATGSGEPFVTLVGKMDAIEAAYVTFPESDAGPGDGGAD